MILRLWNILDSMYDEMQVAVAQSPADLSFPIRTSRLIATQLEKPHTERALA